MKKLFLLVFGALLLSAQMVFAEKTPVENLHEYTLENGLSLFVAENHSVPLVYVEIAVRAGATTQTPETAGLFHLYEHMMFKGNELYRDAAAVQRAVKDMGVSKWNAYTEVDCVHYFFTLPSDQLENGMAFWNAAIRSPLMDPTELENEKKVVLSEIQGDYKNGGKYFSEYMTYKLFPEAPYRLDTGGAMDVVKHATVAQMRDMQSKYYIPSNAALFVGGDVNPEEVHALAKTIYGSWSNNGNSVPALPPQPSMKPFDSKQQAIITVDSESFSPYGRNLAIVYRAPDLAFAREDTYMGDYLMELLNDRLEDFKQSLLKQTRYGFTGPHDINVQYVTRRSGSVLLFFFNVPAGDGLDHEKVVSGLLDEIQKNLLPSVVNKSYAFTPEKKENIINKIKAARLGRAQSAEGLLSLVRSCWASGTADYYYDYYDKLASVTKDEAKAWVKKYITEGTPLVCFIEGPKSYDYYASMMVSHKRRPISRDAYYDGSKYDLVTADTAFWWKDKKFAPDREKIAAQTAVPEHTDIYVPHQEFAASKKYLAYEPPKVDTRQLVNGVPVYLLKDDANKLNFVHIAVRGGTSCLPSSAYSGLEEALFESMTIDSRIYSFETRDKMLEQTRSSISATTYMEGSVLSLGTVDDYLYKVLPVFVDGFMHPSYKKSMYAAISRCKSADVDPIKSDPVAMLRNKMLIDITNGHPYATRCNMTEYSSGYLSEWEKKAADLYSDIVRAENIFVVASGNIDEDKLVSELDKTIGTIQRTPENKAKKKKAKKGQKQAEPVSTEIPPYSITGNDEVLTFKEVAAGTGFAVHAVSAPSNDSDDYLPSLLAADMYNDIMFNVVREHYGVCYTPSAYVSGGKASLGIEELYKISDLEHFVARVNEARGYMAQGKLIDRVGEDGNYVFSTIADRLQSYKNAQIISTYSSLASVQGMGASIVRNLLVYNDMFHTRKLALQIHDMSAEQISSVFQKYWVDAPGKWWVVVAEGDKYKVEFEFDE